MEAWYAPVTQPRYSEVAPFTHHLPPFIQKPITPFRSSHTSVGTHTPAFDSRCVRCIADQGRPPFLSEWACVRICCWAHVRLIDKLPPYTSTLVFAPISRLCHDHYTASHSFIAIAARSCRYLVFELQFFSAALMPLVFGTYARTRAGLHFSLECTHTHAAAFRSTDCC